MSYTMTFDTLAFNKKLEASGIEPRQSEAITQAVSEVFEKNLEDVATKTDLNSLETRLEAKFEAKIDKEINLLDTKIDKMDSAFDSKLSKLKSEIITWVVGIIFTQTAVLLSAVLSIIKFVH